MQLDKSIDPNVKNGPLEDVEEVKHVPPVPTGFESKASAVPVEPQTKGISNNNVAEVFYTDTSKKKAQP